MVVSTLVTCVVGALVHPVAGAALFVVGLVTFGALLCGRGESLFVRLLARAREPRDYELAALRPVVAVLKELDLVSSPVQLLVRDRPAGVRVGAAGRRTVVISQGLVEAIASGRIRPDEAASLLAHAIGRIRLGQCRYDVALEFWMLPWRLLQAVGHSIGRVIGWFPLAAFAWRVRFVTGGVALVQGFTEGQAVFGLIGAGVVALSYAVPWAEQQAALAGEDEADRFVAAAGLGDALCRFLERGRRSPRVLHRVYRLRSVPAPVVRDRTVLAS
ncbi:hypothetical protein [Flexivirga alba]|uniref:Peptidase M48 domain-containing protein n=1 Tax=Flexivirga alba TaxID=702742 RepID=A0ABW2AIE4_9MICO